MIVCITEKPSVARDIAKILGAERRTEHYIEGNGYCITWTYGHLCCLKEPADYHEGWKRWSLGSLPMIPAKFGIKLMDDKGIKAHFEAIEHLVANASEVINCGDAGIEGELIQRWVMQKAGVKCPVKRLWISSLTDEAIKKGFADLKPEADYNNLYYAGLSRAIGDWVLGLNATRLYTLKYSAERGNILSVGRVQTPTLALIVTRQKAIENFTPEPYYELTTLYRDVTFSAASGRFNNPEEATETLQRIEGTEFTVTDVTQKQGREAPPRLFDLTSLQVECNRRWGWSADESLRLIQTLYEKKVATYPRVDTTYLPDDIYPKVPGILKRMAPYAAVTAPLLAGKLPKSKKVFDNSKVTDHHAIIPTGESPASLSGNEKLMYHLIAMRFIAAFYPDCRFDQTTVLGEAAGIAFKATGKVITDAGWRTLFARDNDAEKTDSDGDNAVLPPFVKGEHGPHKPSLTQKMTQPPKPYTEGSLLRAMETAGKTVDDETLREAMKANGIGRPSTRAAIIETLFKRRYIRRERKNIVATAAGIALIDTIHEELLKSAKLTGIWENKLRLIERGEYSAAEFMTELKEMVNQVVINVLNDNSNKIQIEKEPEKKTAARKKADPDAPKKPRKPAIKDYAEIQCPVCGKGHVIKGRTAFGCSNYTGGCRTVWTFEQYPDSLTPAQLARKLKAKK